MAGMTEKTNEDYEVEDACRTLIKAEEIKQNPKLYEKAMKRVEEQHRAMMRVMGGDGKKLMEMMSKKGEEY